MTERANGQGATPRDAPTGEYVQAVNALLFYVDERLDEHARRHPTCRCYKWVQGRLAVDAVRRAS